MSKFKGITFVLFCLINCALSQWTPEIEITQGKLKGIATSSHYKYLGIPYATFQNRFQAPGDAPSWTNTFEAYVGLNTCKQYLGLFSYSIGKEDCLYLNVYTPTNASSDSPIPVMVFIHGGGFYWGGASSLLYGPSPLVDKNVVVVTINYRLGAQGFLCLGVEGAPGNAGLKDLVAALKWVNGNIKAFGGDPDSVTLFGESSGAASVHFLVLSSMASGLFHRAILESGTTLDPWAFTYDPIGKASEVASKLGYTTTDPEELLAIFQNSTADAIAIASYDALTGYELFKPCVETEISGVEAFLSDYPKNILSSGSYNKVPMIIGYNDQEGLLDAGLQPSSALVLYNTNFEYLLPANLKFSSTDEQNEVAATVKTYYFGNATISTDTISILINYFTDVTYHYSSIISSELHLNTSSQVIYNYLFKYYSPRNMGKMISTLLDRPGACHADEVFYIMNPNIRLIPLNGTDAVIMDRMTQLWTDFAKYGNPTPSVTDLVSTAWTASSSSELVFFNIDTELTMGTLPNADRINFWRDIYEKYGINATVSVSA